MDKTKLQCQRQYWNPNVGYYKAKPLSTTLCSSKLYAAKEYGKIVLTPSYSMPLGIQCGGENVTTDFVNS